MTRKAPASQNLGTLDLQTLIDAQPAAVADKYPDMPIDVALLEGNRLAKNVLKYKVSLKDLPTFDVELVDFFPSVVKALKTSETAWNKANKAKAAGSTAPARTEAAALKRRLLRIGRFVFRRDAANLQRVADIAEGSGLADLVNDLNDLSQLVAEHPDLFLKAPGIPKDAVARLKRLAQVLEAGRDDSEATEALRKRNLTFAVCQEVANEIREAVTIVVDGDAKKLKNILSTYVKDQKATARKKNGPSEPNPTPGNTPHD